MDTISSVRETADQPVTASAVIEVCSLFCSCYSPKEPKVVLPPALIARANRFWGDGHPGLAEIVVLAQATDAFDDPGIEGFLERLRNLGPFDRRPALETEPEDERDVIHARLDRIASDARLRHRYGALVRDLWATFSAEWEGGGQARAEAAARAWTTRLDAGTDALELLPEHHIARREHFPAMVRRAQRDGTLRMTPIVAGHGHIVALPGLLSVSADAVAHDPSVSLRRSADEIAELLRVLSDPTRLTILAQLAMTPLGVSDLARTLHIAQPTASVHLRRLKEAGLVSAERFGARSVYSALPEAVEGLLAEVTGRLTRSMAS